MRKPRTAAGALAGTALLLLPLLLVLGTQQSADDLPWTVVTAQADGAQDDLPWT